MTVREAEIVLEVLGAQLQWMPETVPVRRHGRYRNADAETAQVPDNGEASYVVRQARLRRVRLRYLPRTVRGAALIAYYDVPGYTGRYLRRNGKTRWRRYCFGRFYPTLDYCLAAQGDDKCPRLHSNLNRAKAACERHLTTGEWFKGRGKPLCKPRCTLERRRRGTKHYAVRA